MKFTNHHVSDLVVRIKNAAQRNHTTVNVPNVRIIKSILGVLKAEGYITDFTVKTKEIIVCLKYVKSASVIQVLQVVSKPSIRVYKGVQDIPSFYNGLGITIMSTPNGIITDSQARENSVGGEVLCQVF